ncbi:unnamed protein product [Ectocarpus fasciculatus]
MPCVHDLPTIFNIPCTRQQPKHTVSSGKGGRRGSRGDPSCSSNLGINFPPVYREGLECVAVADRLVALRTVLLFCPPISWSAVCADRCKGYVQDHLSHGSGSRAVSHVDNC